MERPRSYRFHQGDRVLPFPPEEYEARLEGLRALMAEAGVEVAVLTSMHGIAYYSGFLYCAFGRPYGLVVTPTESVTISAGPSASTAVALMRCHSMPSSCTNCAITTVMIGVSCEVRISAKRNSFQV